MLHDQTVNIDGFAYCPVCKKPLLGTITVLYHNQPVTCADNGWLTFESPPAGTPYDEEFMATNTIECSSCGWKPKPTGEKYL